MVLFNALVYNSTKFDINLDWVIVAADEVFVNLSNGACYQIIIYILRTRNVLPLIISTHNTYPLAYMVLRVQVKFAHSLLKCGWLWVGHNLCLLWDNLCLLIPSRLPVFAVEPQYLLQYFLFLSKVSFELHIQNLQNISCWFKIWMGLVGPILIKLWTSSIWGFL